MPAVASADVYDPDPGTHVAAEADTCDNFNKATAKRRPAGKVPIFMLTCLPRMASKKK